MSRLYVFDMDGTLLPNTTAMLQIAETTGHKQDLEVLEKQLLEQAINSAQFAKNVFDLWNQLEPETVKTSFVNSPKIGNIESVLQRFPIEEEFLA
ncbi:MAG: hypothetical protein HWD61_15505 [Parachlamydiaceae bacterium]|nr:MAG: hypothetical protein HWD61_15505 [Parachlamydiaceae bacterium]